MQLVKSINVSRSPILSANLTEQDMPYIYKKQKHINQIPVQFIIFFFFLHSNSNPTRSNLIIFPTEKHFHFLIYVVHPTNLIFLFQLAKIKHENKNKVE